MTNSEATCIIINLLLKLSLTDGIDAANMFGENAVVFTDTYKRYWGMNDKRRT